LTVPISRAFLVFLVCVFVCTLTAATVGAQSNAERVSTLTFSSAVQVPGAMLPAGTYVFRQIGGTVDRAGLVQVSTVAPTTQLLAQFRTKPSRRATSGNDVTFRRTLNGTSPPIAVWYFNKGMDGREFLYSTSELRAFATSPTRTVDLKQ
jgi:hypothetical protein